MKRSSRIEGFIFAALLVFTPCVAFADASVTCVIEPSAARAAGAQWKLSDAPDTSWHNSGDVVSGLTYYQYTMVFKDVAGWSRPFHLTIGATDGQTTTISTAYISQSAKGWERIWGANATERADDVAVGVSGSVFVMGYSLYDGFDGQANSGRWDVCVTKWSSGGSKQWTRIRGSSEDEFFSDSGDVEGGMALDSQENVYVCTRTDGSFDGQDNNGLGDFCLLKWNSSGAHQWTRFWGTANEEVACDVAVGPDDSVYVAGFSDYYDDAAGWVDQAHVLKFTSSGNPVWTNTWFGKQDGTRAYNITVDAQNNIYVAGTMFTNGCTQYPCITKLNSSGVRQWTKALANGWVCYPHTRPSGIVCDSSGNIYMAGRMELYTSVTNGDQVFVVKFNSSGGVVWTKTWGSSSSDFGEGIVVDAETNVFVCGATYSDGLLTLDSFLTKLSSDGNVQWSQIWAGDGDGFANAVAIGGTAIYVAGYLNNWPTTVQEDLYLTVWNAASLPAGSVSCSLSPPSAVSAGARWRLTTGPDTGWKNSGEVVTNVVVGAYTLAFSPVLGWDEPSNMSVSIVAGRTLQTNAAYQRQTGAVRAQLSPPEAVLDGAQWKLTAETDSGWQESGALLTNMWVGSYTVLFQNVEGWISPTLQSVFISQNSTTDVYGLYDRRVYRFVSPTGTHLHPFTNWSMASTNIESAVAIASNREVVLVDDGVYRQTGVLNIAKGILLQSVNGAEATTIEGNGALRCVSLTYSSAVVRGFTIRGGNSSTGGGLGLANRATAQACIVVSNNATKGGGVYISTGGVIDNCIIVHNSAWEVGGGVRIFGEGYVRHCVVAHNTCFDTGGGIASADAGEVVNSVVYYNTALASGSNHSGSAILSYCCVSPTPAQTNSCFDALPLFAGDDDYRLVYNSPCIDAGTNLAASGLETDFDGIARPQDGDNNGLSDFDVGAHEYLYRVGSVACTIEPPAAVLDGAQWRLTAGPDIAWKSSGATASNIPVGKYTLEFSDLSGWTTPSNTQVEVLDGQTTSAAGDYSQHVGSVRCTILPPLVAAAGATWRLTTGPDTTWHANEEVVGGVPVGIYTVAHSTVSGWSEPKSEPIIVLQDETTGITGVHIRTHAHIAGNVVYGGPQTGLVHVVAAPVSNLQNRTLALDGDADGAVVALPSAALHLGSNHSMCAWVRLSRNQTGTRCVFLGRYNSGGTIQYEYNLYPSSGQFALEVGDGKRYMTASQTWPTGVWYHLAFAYGDGVGRWYVNGHLDSEATNSSINRFESGSLYIGRPSTTSASVTAWCGCIDEVSLWKRTLTQAEIELYRQSKLVGSEPDLAGYWRFDDGFSNDNSTNKNDASFIDNATTLDTPFPDWVFSQAVIAAPSLYIVTNLSIPSPYTVYAFVDSDGNGVRSSAEAYGSWIGNPVILTDDTANVDMQLDDPDSDSDGIPDYRELLDGTNPNKPDTDDDGFTDLEESIAGTNPTNQMEYFRWKDMTGNGDSLGGPLIWWDSKTGRLYKVHASENLQSWSNVYEVPGNGVMQCYTNESEEAPFRGFQLRVEPQ